MFLTRIIFNPIYLGNWTFCVETEGISSNPIFVYLVREYDKLKIIQNSFSNHSYQTYEPLFPSLKIQVTLFGNPVSNLPIIALLNQGKGKAYIDKEDSIEFNAVWNQGAINFTNDNGIASFEFLTVIGIDSENCLNVSFVFGVASLNPDIVSEESNEYKFCNNFTLTIKNNITNDVMIPLQKFDKNPIKFKIIYNGLSSNMQERIIPFIADLRIIKINSKHIKNDAAKFFTRLNLKNFNCFVINRYSDNCDFIYSYNKIQNNFALHISFSNLMFSNLARIQSISLVICIFNICFGHNSSLANIIISNVPDEIGFYLELSKSLTIAETNSFYIYALLGKKPISYSKLHCNISYISKEGDKIHMRKVMGLYSLDETGVNVLQELGSASNSEILEQGSSCLTQNDGYCLINIKIMKGIQGKYKINCQSDNNIIGSSTYFWINNTLNILIINDTEEIYYIDFDIKEENYIPFKLQIGNQSVKILDSYSHKPFPNKEDKIKLYLGENIIEDLILSYEDSSASEKIKLFYEILSKGPKILSTQNKTNEIQIEIKPAIFNEKEEIYTIFDIAFAIEKPGSYYLIFMCDGVRANKSKNIEIYQQLPNRFIHFCQVYDIYIIFGTLIFFLFLNSIHFPFVITYPIFCVSFVLQTIACIFQNSELMLKIIQLIVIIIIWIFNIYSIIWLRKWDNNFSFIEIKKTVFKLYSLNRFKLLLDKVKIRKLQENDYYNSKKKKLISIEPLSSNNFNQSNKHFNFLKNQKRKLLSKYNQIHQRAPKTIIYKLTQILNSFRNFNEKEAFYYPQQLLIAVALSISCLIYIIPKTVSFSISLVIFIHNIKHNIIEKIFQLENSLINSLQIKLRCLITQLDLSYYDEMVYYIVDVVNTFIISVKRSIITANIISLLCVLFSISLLVYNFRKVILKKRVLGDKLLSSKKIKMVNSSELIGQLLGSTILEYFIFSIILTLFIGLFINKFTWIIIWENLTFIILFFIPSFIDIFVSIIASRIIINDYIYNRSLMQIVDIYKMVMASLEGLNISFYRFVIGLIGVIIGLTRFDKTLMPSWINQIIKLDSMTNSFESCIIAYHNFNNPIKETICTFLLTRLLDKSAKRCQKKIWKTYILKRIYILSYSQYTKKKLNIIK